MALREPIDERVQNRGAVLVGRDGQADERRDAGLEDDVLAGLEDEAVHEGQVAQAPDDEVQNAGVGGKDCGHDEATERQLLDHGSPMVVLVQDRTSVPPSNAILKSCSLVGFGAKMLR